MAVVCKAVYKRENGCVKQLLLPGLIRQMIIADGNRIVSDRITGGSDLQAGKEHDEKDFDYRSLL